MEKSLNKPLRECTIFDLTRDQKQLEDIIGIKGMSEKEYREFSSGIAVILDMLALAEATRNTELEKQIRKEFNTEIASFFNE